MPRFTDEWVVDRTMFEYANGGNCACCSFNPALFMPNGIDGLIESISDLDTDAAENEIAASNNKSPWPLEMRQQIWADRVRLRMKFKQTIAEYRDFWEKHSEDFQDWIRHSLTPKQLKKMLQLPRQEVIDTLHETYNIHSAYKQVMTAVLEQVANFNVTGYETDGVDDSEVDFERALVFDRRGGFTLPVYDKKSGKVNEEVLQVLLNRIESLGNGKLLNRKPSTRVREGEDGDDTNGGDADDPTTGAELNAAKPSFRSDRRIIRLFIARYWADALRMKFLKYKREQQQEEVRSNVAVEADDNGSGTKPKQEEQD